MPVVITRTRNWLGRDIDVSGFEYFRPIQLAGDYLTGSETVAIDFRLPRLSGLRALGRDRSPHCRRTISSVCFAGWHYPAHVA